MVSLRAKCCHYYQQAMSRRRKYCGGRTSCCATRLSMGLMDVSYTQKYFLNHTVQVVPASTTIVLFAPMGMRPKSTTQEQTLAMAP